MKETATSESTTKSTMKSTEIRKENVLGEDTGKTQKEAEQITNTSGVKERLVDIAFGVIAALNALCLLGTVGALELGRIGLLRGGILCAGHLAVCVAATYWGMRR